MTTSLLIHVLPEEWIPYFDLVQILEICDIGTRALFIHVSVRALNGGIAIHLKAREGQGMPNGTVQLYKPDRAASDTTLVLSLDNKGDMFIANPNGIGKFGVIFNFTIDSIPYYALRNIYV